MDGTSNNIKIGEANEVNFGTEVLESVLPVLVVFEVPWSAACNALDTMLGAIAKACWGVAKVVTVDAEVNPGLGIWYEIEYLPTLLYFVKGTVCARLVGAAEEKEILKKLRECISGTKAESKGVTSSE